jgi:hypothetical protein
MENESKTLMPGAAEIRAIAVAAQVDPRTVIKVMRGQKVQPMNRRRVLDALHERAEAKKFIR